MDSWLLSASIGEAATTPLLAVAAMAVVLGLWLRSAAAQEETAAAIGIVAGARPATMDCVCCSRRYFGLRGNGMKPSRFGILTLGSDCASSTSSFPMISFRLRM
jgi:hypothetical protein